MPSSKKERLKEDIQYHARALRWRLTDFLHKLKKHGFRHRPWYENPHYMSQIYNEGLNASCLSVWAQDVHERYDALGEHAGSALIAEDLIHGVALLRKIKDAVDERNRDFITS